MKRFNSILLAMLLAVALTAPAAAAGSIEAGGMGGFMFGVIPLDVAELNSRLAPGYPALPQTVIGFGGTGQAFVKRVVLGGEAMGFWTPALAGNAHNVTLTGGYGLFRVGYVLKETETTRIYPMVGLGAAVASLKFIPKTAPDFNGVLADPGQAAELSWIAPVIDVALGADHLVTLGEDPAGRGSGGLAVGLRVGYMQTFAPRGWRMGELDVPNGPGFGFTGPYVRLVFGGGGHGTVEIPEKK